MKLEEAKILEHREISGGYRLLVLESPAVASNASPGQFVHLRVPGLDCSVLRRPFSIYLADASTLRILYKQVGKGTREMAAMPKGRTISLIGPLGSGFPLPPENTLPVLVAGGYGVAPLYFLATRIDRPGLLFAGGRSAGDILCASDFQALGWEVQITTEDGSQGIRGRVTDALDPWLKTRVHDIVPVFYACGPDGLLRAVDHRATEYKLHGWLSLDKHMGCGVGACLACVQRVHTRNGSQWKRVCKDGPIFGTGEIFWDYGVQADNAS